MDCERSPGYRQANKQQTSMFDGNIRDFYAPTIIIVLLCAYTTAFMVGCNSNKLSQSHAVEVITSSDSFKKPAAIYLQPEYKDNLPSFGKTSEEQAAYAMKWFYKKNPELAVLNHLALVDFRVVKMDYPDTGGSLTTVASFLTDKGRAASKDWQQIGDAWVITLASRKLGEVTGIAGGEGNSKSARVEYTWRWEPTETGKYFDISGSAYQQLPETIRESFSGRSVGSMIKQQGNVTLFDSSKMQKETANLQLYDDGWRITK
jgi:hypothetical protein